VDHGLGFDGFVSVNLQLNLWLYAAAAADSDGNNMLSQEEFTAMRKQTVGYNVTWVSVTAATSSSAIDIRNKAHLKTVFANHIGNETNLTYSNLIHAAFQENAFLKWAQDQLSVGKRETPSVVESVDYIKKHSKGKVNYDSRFYKWIQDYQVDETWTNAKLRCTELTMKCGEFSEPEIPLLSSEVDRWGVTVPSYAECKCESMDNNANFRTFGTAFITLVRMSTGEYWNGIMHDLSDTESHTYAFAYFFTFLILATFIMLNLVVAVMIINYNEQQADSGRL
jgi:hypothetical protein